MKSRFLLIGIASSLALHGILFLGAARLERSDPREQMRTVKLRMVERGKEKREQEQKEEEIKRALDKLEKPRELKEAAPEDIAKVKEAQKQLEELRRKLADEAKKRQEELLKKQKKPEPKPEPKAEEKPAPEPDKKAEVKPEKKPVPRAQSKPRRKKSGKRETSRKKVEKKAEADPAKSDKPPPPTPDLAGAQKGAPIDLDYTMKGGTSNNSEAGSSVSVTAGDGMDIPEEGYDDDPSTALSEQEAAPAEEQEEFQEEFQDAEEEAALPDEEGREGPGSGPIAGSERRQRKKDPRARKVKTTSKHRVTRSAEMTKRVSVKYPDEVKALEIQGRVYLEVTVDAEGKVANVKLKKGLHPVLDKVAIEAAWQLEFSPALKEGEAVGVKITVPFTFVLE